MTPNPIIARVSVVPAQRQRLPHWPAPAWCSKACPKWSSSSARCWRRLRNASGPTPIIASTTSTILVDDLSGAIEHPRALSQRALAQPGLSDPAGRDFAGHSDRSRHHRTGQGAARRHRQGAGGLRGDARLHRAAHPGAGHERGGADGGGRRRQRRRISTRRSATVSAFATRCWACWNSSTGAAATFSITPAAISKARSAATAIARRR